MQNAQGCFGIPKKQSFSIGEVYVTSRSGYGSVNTNVPRWTNIYVNVGPAVTYVDDLTMGGYVRINETGVYCIGFNESKSSGGFPMGLIVAKNLSALASVGSTSIASVSYSQGRVLWIQNNTTVALFISRTIRLNAGDIVSTLTDGSDDGGQEGNSQFLVSKVCD